MLLRGMQALGAEKGVVYARNNGEGESGPQSQETGNIDPLRPMHRQQQDKEHSQHLRGGVGFAEDAGPEIAQAGGGIEDRTHHQDRNIAPEHHDRELPGNAVQQGKHQEHGAHQHLVGHGVEILAQPGLLVETPGQLAVKKISDSSRYKKAERPLIVSAQQAEHDEGKKDHAQQRELIGNVKELCEFHSRSPAAAASPNRRTGSRPVCTRNRSHNEGRPPACTSSSMRSTRCMGKKSVVGVKGSPALSMAAESSNDSRSMPRTLMPAPLRASNRPQNFSRGSPRASSTMAPL